MLSDVHNSQQKEVEENVLQFSKRIARVNTALERVGAHEKGIRWSPGLSGHVREIYVQLPTDRKWF